MYSRQLNEIKELSELYRKRVADAVDVIKRYDMAREWMLRSQQELQLNIDLVKQAEHLYEEAMRVKERKKGNRPTMIALVVSIISVIVAVTCLVK